MLKCVHALESSGGCGSSEACKTCIIRKAVFSAFEGKQSSRQRAMMERIIDGKSKPMHLLVTSSAFEYQGRSRALLVLEDISELIALRELLPICARCKKIRDDQKYWHALEEYCHHQLSLDFTHSICPDCARELYGKS